MHGCLYFNFTFFYIFLLGGLGARIRCVSFNVFSFLQVVLVFYRFGFVNELFKYLFLLQLSHLLQLLQLWILINNAYFIILIYVYFGLRSRILVLRVLAGLRHDVLRSLLMYLVWEWIFCSYLRTIIYFVSTIVYFV